MVLRNCSQRLVQANLSKLGWQAKVIWRIAISTQIKVSA
jgi:G:T-mismatch repair DNA endonuclease (very short patch repair protein)